MSSWSNFKTNNNLIVTQSEIPYISGVEGVAILGVNSTITIKGFNFNPSSEVICNAGIISNIKKDPETIIFDCLASSPGSFLVEVRNGTLSSLDWNSDFQPVLMARNPLNLTNGWLDFRTANSSNFGSVVVSHINQGLATKTFANSGYTLDVIKGLCIGSKGTNNSSSLWANYIQFNDYLFPLTSTKLTVVYNTNTEQTNVATNSSFYHNLRMAIGNPLTNNNNITNNTLVACSNFSGNTWIDRRYNNSSISTLRLYPLNPILINSIYNVKVIFDYFNNTVNVYMLNDLNNLDAAGTLVMDNIPIQFKENNYVMSPSGIPLFQFQNPSNLTPVLSSVIAMKID
ncbi:MAG TPA: hypothetical protein V6D21_07590 [Candidatus Obscuribacterales bacterium]